MSRFIALTKILLKTNGESLGKGKGKIKLKGIVLILILIAGFMPMAIGIGAFVSKVYDMLAPINQQGALLGLGFSIVSMIIFFLGIFYVMGTFYFSMDIEYLLPLPFKASHIIGAKFVVVLVYEYLTEIITLAPIIIAYGISDNAGVLYYIFGILVFLTLPLIPLIISSILVMLIMRFTSIAKNKDRFKTIGGIIAIFIGLSLNVIVQKTALSLTNPEQIQKMFMEGNNSLIKLASQMFPSVKLAALALVENTSSKGIMNLILFMAITIIALIIFIIVSEGLYFKGVIGISETTTKRKELSNGDFSKATVQNSLLKAYTMKELKVLFRTPAYFMNCILINFFWPVIILLPAFANSGDISSLGMISKLIDDPKMIPIILAGAIGAIVFVSSSNAIASTAISREGKGLFVNKYMPISYKTQIMSKVLSGFIMGLVGMIMLVIVFVILAKPPILLIILIITIGLLANLFANLAGIFIDLSNPKLDWDNEQKAVKQNINSLLNWIPCLVVSGLVFFIVYKVELSLMITSILMFSLYGIIDLILYKLVGTKGAELYDNL